MIPVILSGGSGSRLWPLSRGMFPKQLLPLIHPQLTLLQQTIQRAEKVSGIESPIVVCNDEHRFMVGEQLNQIGIADATIILEPEGRNTAPAIALAAWQALSNRALEKDDPILLVMPADHIIDDIPAFQRALAIANEAAQRGSLVTFGIVPKKAETGYGYIKARATDGADPSSVYDVEEFKEKPPEELAKQYLASGDYFWNGGIFVFRASVYLKQLSQFAPEIHQASKCAMQAAIADLDFIRADPASFTQSPSDSIDYAVMEKTNLAKLVPLDAGWSDVGSWEALWQVSDKDQYGNSIHGDVLLHDTNNSHIYSESKLVAAVGVDDLVVVVTEDAVLVSKRTHSQQVKRIVEQLAQQDRSQLSHHRKVYRPWGWYDSIDVGSRFQVKRIQVKPGARLSVQMHHHRAEHWVVVKGEAEVLNGDSTMKLEENQSTYIPIGATHSLRNASDTEPLEIIEVQSGEYLGEDDIVRFSDEYGRAD